MKLLFDQNLPPRLTSSLADLYPESSHVMSLELDQASDREIREFASQNSYTIVTKDADFGDRLETEVDGSRMRGVGQARVHHLECVEIEIDEWEPGKGWKTNERTAYGRLTAEEVQWLAMRYRTEQDERRLATFLDEDFLSDWGKAEPRRLSDEGCLVETGDRIFARRSGAPGVIGAGMFSVSIGSRHFACLRVIDVEERASEQGILVEGYVDETGRTVLFRRYNGRLWRLKGERSSGNERPPWDEALSAHRRLTMDGATFVHWYDCLTGRAGWNEPDGCWRLPRCALESAARPGRLQAGTI